MTSNVNHCAGSFFIQVDPKTGHIKALGKGNGVEALYIAAGPLGGDGPIYLLARQAVNLSLTQCLQDKGERSDRNGAILTPNGFSGSGLFFDSDEEFEPTGMVLDSVYTNMVYIAGYFKVELVFTFISRGHNKVQSCTYMSELLDLRTICGML